MATADVASLYTITSHQQGLEAVKFYLKQDHSLPQMQKDFVIELLILATGHNYFCFGGYLFLQTCGVAMGATFAPSLANLFMARWEKEVIDTDPPRELRLWRRYIDDVLLLWDGNLPSLEAFFFQDSIRMIEASPYSMRRVTPRFISFILISWLKTGV